MLQCRRERPALRRQRCRVVLDHRDRIGEVILQVCAVVVRPAVKPFAHRTEYRLHLLRILRCYGFQIAHFEFRSRQFQLEARGQNTVHLDDGLQVFGLDISDPLQLFL